MECDTTRHEVLRSGVRKKTEVRREGARIHRGYIVNTDWQRMLWMAAKPEAKQHIQHNQ